MARSEIIRIGISACLLGRQVRYDAGHKQDRYLTDILGQFVKFVPVCPEVEVGMPVPRESVRLTGSVDALRMIGNKSGEDWTGRMNSYSKERIERRDFSSLNGFILKKGSPSCGMERVKVYVANGQAPRKGSGLFAGALMQRHPDLPIEEEGRLQDASLRENFIERIFAHKRLQVLFEKPFRRGSMIEFHAAHKFQLLAHSPELYRQSGRLIGMIKELKPTEFKSEYSRLFMKTLKHKATAKKNRNVLEHIAGFLKRQLSAPEKKDIQQTIEDYHRGLIPLIVPITLLRHFVNRYEVEYIQNQYYLNPHPKELMLRNHV